MVILDRDGVINADSDAYIKSVEEWHPLPGSVAAIADLFRAGYRIAVASNQSGLARGYFDGAALAGMHARMIQLVEEAGGEIDVITWCPHGPDDGCACRKPLPGLLDSISETLGLPVTGAWLVGDSLKDVEAARARGCRPILVRTGKGTGSERALTDAHGEVPVFDDLRAAADWILAQDAGVD